MAPKSKPNHASRNGHRLSFLIVETEVGQALSTRKLLIESAKHNVLTAHSAQEGLEMFKRFPNVDAVVIDSHLKDNNGLAREIKKQNSKMRIICLAPNIAAKAPWADETTNSHDPAALLKMLEQMGGRTDI